MELIYRYRSWKNRYDKALLEKCELFWAKPSSFNDPEEFVINSDFRLLTDAELWNYCEESIGRFRRNEIDFLAIQRRQNPIEESKKFDCMMGKTFEHSGGVICFSKGWDLPSVWGHYADSHKGYCLGFDWVEMLNHFTSNEGKGVAFKRVKYVSTKKKLKPNYDTAKLLRRVVFRKGRDWKKEKEYRLFYLSLKKLTDGTKVNDKFKGCELIFQPMPESERKQIFPRHLIKEIVMGVNIEPSSESEIKSIAKRHGIPLYKCHLLEEKFGLGREKVL